MSTYGYIRVSTKEQNEDRQVIAMQEHDIPVDHIISWKNGRISGRAAARELGVAHETFRRWCAET